MLQSFVRCIIFLMTSYHSLSAAGGIPATTNDKYPLIYRVAEELPRATFVANLSNDVTGVISGLSSDARELIRFRFLADFQPLFDIDSISGVIRTADIIDRDLTSLCRQKEVCDVNLDVVLQPVRYFQLRHWSRTCSRSHNVLMSNLFQHQSHFLQYRFGAKNGGLMMACQTCSIYSILSQR